MSKTIFDVDDIYALRTERVIKYMAMSVDSAQKLRSECADNEWIEIAKIRKIFYRK